MSIELISVQLSNINGFQAFVTYKNTGAAIPSSTDVRLYVTDYNSWLVPFEPPVMGFSVTSGTNTVTDIYNFNSAFTQLDIVDLLNTNVEVRGTINSDILSNSVIITEATSLPAAPEPAVAAGTSVTAYSPVEVNFNVEIDADSALNIFGEQAPTVSNIIVAQGQLPVNALYDGELNKGLIELWEPSAEPDNIKVKLANTDSSSMGGENLVGAYQATSKLLAKGLQKVLLDQFDCSNAAPFSTYADVEYTTQKNFGRVALANLAHSLFGHVDATSAITNDTAFVNSMLSMTGYNDTLTAGSTAVASHYANWNKSVTADVEQWSTTASSTDANLAIRLVRAIVDKGANGAESSVTDSNRASQLSDIVAQVVGQDASRLMDGDNSQRTKDVHKLLRFYPGDVIYMNIKVKKPTVTVGTGQQVASATLQDKYATEQSYTLKITLKAKDATL